MLVVIVLLEKNDYDGLTIKKKYKRKGASWMKGVYII